MFTTTIGNEMDQIQDENNWAVAYSACQNAKNGNAAWLTETDIAFIGAVEARVDGGKVPRSSEVQRLSEIWSRSPIEVAEQQEAQAAAIADGSAYESEGTPVIGETPDADQAPEIDPGSDPIDQPESAPVYQPAPL